MRIFVSLILLHISAAAVIFSSVLSVDNSSINETDHLIPEKYELNIIHLNDFHAHYEEKCNTHGCFGGYARVASTIKNLNDTLPNAIYLNAGDNFVGSKLFICGSWNITSELLNMVPPDAMTLGNHEFNDVPTLAKFLNEVRFPVVVANIDVSDEPKLRNSSILKSIVIRKNGRDIGIVGIDTYETVEISNPAKVRFFKDNDTRVLNELQALRKRVDIVILLTHVGADVDINLGEEWIDLVDVIIGGHTHTVMYAKDTPPDDLEKNPISMCRGRVNQKLEYPTLVTSATSNRKVLIAHAGCYSKYVGNLNVYFNVSSDGKINGISHWSGKPVYLDSSVTQDVQVMTRIETWKARCDGNFDELLGISDVSLDKNACLKGECDLGDFVTDAYLNFYRNQTTFNVSTPIVAFLQTGAMRTSIKRGNVSYGDIAEMHPFGNRVVSFDLLGTHLEEAFLHSASLYQIDKHLLQVSGMRNKFRRNVNAENKVSLTVISLEILEPNSTDHYEPLDRNRTYRVVTVSFLAAGKNGYKMFENKTNYIEKETDEVLDRNVVANYLRTIGEIKSLVNNRITFETIAENLEE